MIGFIKKLLRTLGIYNVAKDCYYNMRLPIIKPLFLMFPPFEPQLCLLKTHDPVRYATISLAIARILKHDIPGAFAEVGVFQGHTSKIIHRLAPDRKLFLFDTFEGFPDKDLAGRQDNRFKDTGIDLVKKVIGNTDNIYFRKGYFPESAIGLEYEWFAFVMLDVDLYAPTLSGMEFFYSRLSPGGYIFIHDYNSPESNRAVSKAINTFMADKREGIVCIPDACGSAIICKNGNPTN